MEKGDWKFIVAALLVFLLGLSFTWWLAGQESAAFYRVTGKKISQWDALFLELRVQND